MKRHRSFIWRICAFFLIPALGMSVCQEKIVFASSDEDGVIEIQLNDFGTSMENVEFSAYKVAEMDEENGNWVLHENVSVYCSEIDLNQDKNAEQWDREALQLTSAVKKSEPSCVVGRTKSDGNCVLSNLEEGMYLIIQSNMAEYGNVSPFLVSIPYQDNGAWVNKVTVNPKGEKFHVETDVPEEVVETGDDSKVLEYVLLGLGAVVCGGIVFVNRKRKLLPSLILVLVTMMTLPTYVADSIASETIPEWATNVTIETPPDEQYVYQFSDSCPIYQRAQYRFDCGTYYSELAPVPVILLVDGSKYNETVGKTWTANMVEYLPGKANYELTYCADLITDTVGDQFYKKINVEDSTYFANKEDAYKLRAIVSNTYPFVSAVDMVKILHEKNLLNTSILLNDKTFDDELTTADIDVGQLVTASQMSIWVVCNNYDESTAYADAEIHTIHTLITPNMKLEGKLNPLTNYYGSNAGEDGVTTHVAMTEGQAENINAIYKYFMDLDPVTEEEAEQNQQLVITDIDYGVTKTGTGNYDLTVRVLLNTAIKKNDNLTIKVSSSEPDSNGNAIEAVKVFESQGSGEVIGKEFSFELQDVPVGADITIELSGNQYLNQGVYFYEPYVAEGETERSTSQNMVGASVGYTPVKAETSFNIDDARTEFELEKYTEVDGNRIVVEGAEFEFGIYNGTEYKPIFTGLKSDANGKIILEISENQKAGEGESYYFKETDPAPGFATLENPIFIVEPGEKIEVENALETKMPATGASGTMWVYNAGMLCIFVHFCFAIKLKIQKTKEIKERSKV